MSWLNFSLIPFVWGRSSADKINKFPDYVQRIIKIVTFSFLPIADKPLTD